MISVLSPKNRKPSLKRQSVDFTKFKQQNKFETKVENAENAPLAVPRDFGKKDEIAKMVEDMRRRVRLARKRKEELGRKYENMRAGVVGCADGSN